MPGNRFALPDVPPAYGRLRIWQQNLNTSLTAQLDLLNYLHPSTIDIIALQEPYFDHLRNTRASCYWTVVYPPGHKDSEKPPRSVLLVNNQTMSTNTWEPITVPSTDLTVICVTNETDTIFVYNSYNDQKYSDTLRLLETETKKSMTTNRNRYRTHALSGSVTTTDNRPYGMSPVILTYVQLRTDGHH